MISSSRRSFIALGFAGASASVVRNGLAQTSAPRSYQPAVPAQYKFLLQRGAIARLDNSTAQAGPAAPWAVRSESIGPNADLTTPQIFSVDQVEAWIAAHAESCCVSGSTGGSLDSADPLDALMNVRLATTLDVRDIEAAVAEPLTNAIGVDTTLDFLYSSRDDLAYSYRVMPGSGVPMLMPLEPAASEALPHDPTSPTMGAPPSVELFGWRLQFRGPETHPLGSCVSSAVNHFHVELFHARGGGRYDYAANFHLGTYRSGGSRCFVLYNNIRPVVCWKTCSPSSGDLAGMFRWMIVAAASVLAVAIAAWIVASIAEAAASVAFVPLLLLA